jgi:hypothetical protein
MSLVRLPNGDWINPAWVVAVRRCNFVHPLSKWPLWTSVGIIGSGSSLTHIDLEGDVVDEIAGIILTGPPAAPQHQQSFPKNEASPHHH